MSTFNEQLDESRERIASAFGAPVLMVERPAYCPRCGNLWTVRSVGTVEHPCPLCGWKLGDSLHRKQFMEDVYSRPARHPSIGIIVVWAIFFFAGGVAFGIGIGLVIAR